jgi:hypothetical protein
MSNDRHRSRVEFRALLARTLQTVGISEAAGLNFFNRSIHRRSLRASTEVSGVNELGTRSTDRQLQLRRLKIVHYNLGRFHRLRSLTMNRPGHNQLRLLKHRQLYRRKQLRLDLRPRLDRSRLRTQRRTGNQFRHVILRQLQLVRQKQPEVHNDEQE